MLFLVGLTAAGLDWVERAGLVQLEPSPGGYIIIMIGKRRIWKGRRDVGSVLMSGMGDIRFRRFDEGS